MSERLFDHDPDTGMKTWFSSSDDNQGTWQFRYEQDCNPILDENKSTQADGFDKRSDFWHAAKIPNVIIMEWMTKHGVNLYDKNHAAGVRRLLNDPDYRYLRVQHFII